MDIAISVAEVAQMALDEIAARTTNRRPDPDSAVDEQEDGRA